MHQNKMFVCKVAPKKENAPYQLNDHKFIYIIPITQQKKMLRRRCFERKLKLAPLSKITHGQTLLQSARYNRLNSGIKKTAVTLSNLSSTRGENWSTLRTTELLIFNDIPTSNSTKCQPLH